MDYLRQIPATALNLPVVFEPVRPRVKWAYEPDDVPEWDWSRGFDGRSEIVQPQVWEQAKKTLNGLTETPELTYPRLVRETPFHEGVGAEESLDSMLPVFRRLAHYLPKANSRLTLNTRFKEGVLAAVQKVGLLDPEGTGDGLFGWCLAVVEARGWLEWSENLRAVHSKPAVIESIATFNDPVLADSGWLELFRDSLRKAAGPVVGGTNAEWLKTTGLELMSDFLASSVVFRPTRDNRCLSYRGGASVWLKAEIAMMMSAAHQRRCANESCKRKSLFTPLHGNQKYCCYKCERATARRRYPRRSKKVSQT